MKNKLSSITNVIKSILLFVACVCSQSAAAFVISDIRLEGLQRISAGTVFGAVPYSIGDNIGSTEIQDIARSIFRTESFDDVQVGRDKNVLVNTTTGEPGNVTAHMRYLSHIAQKDGNLRRSAGLDGLWMLSIANFDNIDELNQICQYSGDYEVLYGDIYPSK